MTKEQIKKILKDLLETLGWEVWKNKNSMLFTLRAKYGSQFNSELTSNVYDNLFKKEKEIYQKEEL